MFKINIVENKIKHVIMIFFVFIMNFTVSQAVETVPTVSNPTVFSSLIMSFGELVFSGVTKVNGAVVIIFLALSVISVYISIVFTPGASIEGIFSMILKRGINARIFNSLA